jgi:hypothetical protein
MGAIGEDPRDYRRITSSPLPLHKRGKLFGYIWDHAESFKNDFCVGISLHRSREDGGKFSEQYYQGLDKKYGRVRAPPKYYRRTSNFEVRADQRLIDLVCDFAGRDFKIEDRLKQVGSRTNKLITRREPMLGVYATIPTAKYLPRLNLLSNLPENLQRVISESEQDFIEELMSVEKVIAEIVEDTQFWYETVSKREATDQWKDI